MSYVEATDDFLSHAEQPYNDKPESQMPATLKETRNHIQNSTLSDHFTR